MLLKLLKCKLHRAVVTHSDLNYEGSITIDSRLMKKAGILPFEKVLIADITRGTRWETYVIAGKEGTGIIGLNGAAARLGKIGDKLTIMAFVSLQPKEAKQFRPKVITLEGKNKIPAK